MNCEKYLFSPCLHNFSNIFLIFFILVLFCHVFIGYFSCIKSFCLLFPVLPITDQVILRLAFKYFLNHNMFLEALTYIHKCVIFFLVKFNTLSLELNKIGKKKK